MADEPRNPLTVRQGYQPKVNRGYTPNVQPQPAGQAPPKPPQGGSGVPATPPGKK
jgi:hypothetical protein